VDDGGERRRSLFRSSRTIRSADATPGHAQFPYRRRLRLRHRRLIAKRAVEQEAHHQRSAEPFLGRLDSTFDEEWRAPTEGQVEWCVTNRRFSRFVPLTAMRSPNVWPIAWDSTMTHWARVT
jgi:hypothetical protein